MTNRIHERLRARRPAEAAEDSDPENFLVLGGCGRTGRELGEVAGLLAWLAVGAVCALPLIGVVVWALVRR